jgi:Tfp pilus assembly protein PilW
MIKPVRFIIQRVPAARMRGMSLVETMVGMAISLFVMLALVAIYVNVARGNEELAKTNSLIENGRISLQIIEADLVHAGFWDGYLPRFDDLTASETPGDVASALPDPCTPYASWDGAYKTNLVAIPLQSTDVLWSGAGCLSPAAQRPGTDAVAIHYLETCIPGAANCDAPIANRLYFQNSTCAAEKLAGTASGGTASSITFNSASATNNAYSGAVIRTISGVGAGQFRSITDYNGSTRTATVSPNWSVAPNSTTVFALEYVLGTSAFPLHKRNCVGTGIPAALPVTAGTSADLRRFISNIYYVADLPHPDLPGETVPTLMRSQFDLAGGVLVQRAPVALIDGVESLRVEIGIDDVSETGAPVDFSGATQWADPATMTSPTNRGDGVPDRFVRCTTASPCTAADLINAVAVKLWVLARSREQSRDYVDAKQYCLGALDSAGACPADSIVAAVNDHYKRHVFSTSVRLVNVSGRRETPFP